jgi:uncharacterized protein with PIN domain
MIDRPRFISDAMLGSLAKWLRILGFDTLYYRVIEDRELVKIAKQEGRTILSRDSALCQSKKTGESLLIQSDKTVEQLKEVMNACHIVPNLIQAYMRCTLCNGKLISVEWTAVSTEVPDHVLQSTNAFLKCGECGKVYWEGSHKKSIDAVIAAIMKDMGDY